MKPNWKHLDKYRGQEPPYKSPPGATYGAFQIPFNGVLLRIIATNGAVPDLKIDEWEHVSIHAFDPVFKKVRCPKWDEMCFIKDLFWNDDEAVMQYHPAKSDYVNVHDHVLHLWRNKKVSFPMPPKICV